MIECEGKIFEKTISIMIDPGASLRYVRPRIIEECYLQSIKF